MKEASLLHFCLWDTPYIPHTESDSSKRMYNSINLAAHAKVFIPKSQGFQFVIGVEFGGMFAFFDMKEIPIPGIYLTYRF